MTHPRLCSLAVLLLLCSLAGCNVIGAAAQALPPPTIKPKYTGLTKQSVGVMVWADRGVRMDFPKLQLDVANAVQEKLIQYQQGDKKKRFVGTTFPLDVRSVIKYQRDHPEMDGAPIIDVAPNLGVTRLIYVEVEEFSTRSNISVDLYRGSATGTVRMVEIEKDHGKVVLEEDNVRVVFPKKSREEGELNATDYVIYRGTLDAFTTQVVNLFVPHEEEEE